MAPIVQSRFEMRVRIAGITAMSFVCSIAFADPEHPPPPVEDPAPTVAPPAFSPSTNPALPIVTLSTMPVSKTIPGWWDSARLGALTLSSAFITAAIWARHYHAAHEILVSPTQGGASVALAKEF